MQKSWLNFKDTPSTGHGQSALCNETCILEQIKPLPTAYSPAPAGLAAFNDEGKGIPPCLSSISTIPFGCRGISSARLLCLAADELHGHLRQRIGLTEHGHGGLGEYLVPHKFGHFRGHIHVRNARFSGLQVLCLDVQVGDGIFQPVLQSTEMGTDFIFFDDGSVDFLQHLLGCFLGLDGVRDAIH